jgi:hypothetical protein
VITLPPRAPQQPQQGREVGEVLSPSQLRTWMDCQARWMFRYVHRLPDPANSTLALGKAVHHALGLNFHQKVETGVDLPAPEVVRAYCDAWRKEASTIEFEAHEDATEIGMEGVGLVQKYMFEAAGSVHPAAVEISVGDTDQAQIGGVRVRGVIDILDVEGRIIDLKTARRSPSRIDASQMLQLATYAAVTPGARGTVRIDAMVRNKTPKVVSFSAKLSTRDYVAIERLYPLAQQGMRGGYYMPNRTSMLCSRRNCAYWRECEREFGGIVEAC